MSILDFFRKPEKKNFPDSSDFDSGRIVVVNNGVIEYVGTSDNKLSPSQVYDMFSKIPTLFDAVEKISSRVAGLSLVLTKDGDIIKKHPALDLLNAPGKNISKTAFWDELSTSFALCYEGWLVLRGNISKPPLEMEVLEPYAVDAPTFIASDALMPDIISTDSKKDCRRYNKKIIDGVERYICRDELNELIPIIGKRYKDDWRGMSKLSVLLEEAIQIRAGNIHNRNLLENGLTSSIILATTNPDGIDPDKASGFKKTVQEQYQGFNNAGKPMFLPLPFTKVSESTNNKDMDYIQLITMDETRIYRVFNIPLPLISDKSMTYSNLEHSIPFLYSDAVFPVFNYLADELTLKLMPRFKNAEGLRIAFDKFEIPALYKSQADTMKELKASNVLTTNEVRAKGGYASIDGGDDIIIPVSVQKLKDIDEPKGYPEA